MKEQEGRGHSKEQNECNETTSEEEAVSEGSQVADSLDKDFKQLKDVQEARGRHGQGQEHDT